jgi:hypothetical protein
MRIWVLLLGLMQACPAGAASIVATVTTEIVPAIGVYQDLSGNFSLQNRLVIAPDTSVWINDRQRLDRCVVVRCGKQAASQSIIIDMP